MKLLMYAIVALILSGPVFGAEPAASQQSSQVRVEVLMVSMPQDKALALLPDLYDAAKIEGAVSQIMAALGRNEATLTGLPMVLTKIGQKSVSETVVEKRYPTEYERSGEVVAPAAEGTPAAAAAVAPTKAKAEMALPTRFETRNLGPTLEVEPMLSADGKRVDLSFVAQRVEFLGFNTYYSLKTVDGVSKIEQPRFAVIKVTTSVSLRSGQRCLVGVHKLVEPEGHLEFFIIQATTIPVQ